MFGDVKGNRNVVYTFGDLLFWGFMLEIAQFGLDPQRMVQVARGIWPAFEHLVSDEASHEGNDLYFAAEPVVLSASILEDNKALSYRVAGLTTINKSEFRYTFDLSELQSELPTRAILINLSALYRKAKAAAKRLTGGSTHVRPEA